MKSTSLSLLLVGSIFTGSLVVSTALPQRAMANHGRGGHVATLPRPSEHSTYRPRPVPDARHRRPRPGPPPRYPRPVPPPRYPYPTPPPHYPPPGGYEQDFFARNLYMNFTGYQILDLRSIMGITSIYNGRDVEYVIVRARSRFGYGTLQLRTNFQPNSAIMSVGTYPQEYYLHVTGNRELGWGVNTLELQIMGDMTIETIAVQLDRRRRY